MSNTIDSKGKNIDLLKDIPDILTVRYEGNESSAIKVIKRAPSTCKSYISPNRREFYKIMFSTKGIGLFTVGLNNFYIDKPTILFLHPNEIISWRKLDAESEGFLCFFQKKLVEDHPILKSIIEKYQLFSNSDKSVIRLNEDQVQELNKLFGEMFLLQSNSDGALTDDAMQAYLQLMMIASVKSANYALPDSVTEDFHHVHSFFQLLEKETANVNFSSPIRIKTAKEFADQLLVHPNHLNVLLKKHTGQNVSTHIRNRLLEESKILLKQTDWSLQDIGYSIGFSDQPNFSQFFKKNTGVTPAEYRKGDVV